MILPSSRLTRHTLRDTILLNKTDRQSTRQSTYKYLCTFLHIQRLML